MVTSEAEINNSRSEKTRNALIQAGIVLFSEHGFTATTTRMLAKQANVNIAAIPYYFNNKTGLYLATIHHIVERVQTYLGSNMQLILADRQNLNPDDALSHLNAILKSLVQLFIEKEEIVSFALIIMKEQIKPTDAFNILYDSLMCQVHEAVTYILAALTNSQANDETTIIKSHMLLGEILVFISSRELLLRRLGVQQLTHQHIKIIFNLLEQRCQTLIGARSTI